MKEERNVGGGGGNDDAAHDDDDDDDEAEEDERREETCEVVWCCEEVFHDGMCAAGDYGRVYAFGSGGEASKRKTRACHA